ncbi:hypothetical protein SAMN00808754_3210 [Thermanaeromonas toyohensis ToBE]|uniref:Uncharacterized protein n=1 Tax=Thermanaeromonas toyohensis ToBE TaxID=698762 RepID=A0A1W1W311_9FIRM|nr:hypothetical protein [Thermanaeromonas toyohensis]SMC00007.1 hypothetical protein SAMN00808754_3210 [Thermanaeromonas toyohensis ToBE]
MVKETFPAAIYALFLQDFPESLAMSLLVFSILGLKLRDKRIIYIALLQALTNLVRHLPIAFGMHSVLLLFSLVLYTRLFTRQPLSRIFLAGLVCFTILAISELLYTKPLLNLTGIPYTYAFTNPFLRAAFALPGEITLLVVALGKNYYNQKKGLIC